MTEKPTIMIIEDEMLVALDIKNRVTGFGYEVIGLYNSGTEALEQLAKQRADVILMDINLEDDVDGIETASTIRSQYDIPVIYISAFTDDEITSRAKITEPFAYLVKPIEDTDLRIAIELALYKHSMAQEKTALAEKLRQKNKELEKINKELDTFVHMASHDLRSPLQSITTYVGLLQDFVEAHEPDEELTTFIERIFSNIRLMNKLIEDFVNMSRISRIQNPYESVDCTEAVKKVLERLELDIKNNKVRIDIQKNIPPVYCDRIKLVEVFFNLLSNAIKFASKRETGRPEISLTYEEKNNAHVFCVKDNGIGIDKRYFKKITTPFFRLHAKDAYEGSGLGLYLVKRIVDEHRGSIWFESEPFAGTSVFVSIPKSLTDPSE